MQRTDGPAAGRGLSRRRFITIAGAVAGATFMPNGAVASLPLHRWHGVALGAEARLFLAHPDEAAARNLISRCIAEVRRLERIFSLYDPASSLAELNRTGRLDEPPLELVELLGRARQVSAATGGAFDPTVQPLWSCYAEHFSQARPDPAGPDIDTVRKLVDWRLVSAEPGRIAFVRPGMAVTLNGIAQGFITDAVARLLEREGIGGVLVDLGELRALGGHPDGRPWRIGIDDPRQPQALVGRLDLADRALATSGGYGTVFDEAGQFGHLIDPRSGRTVPVTCSTSVMAGDATMADALSTAFAVMSHDEIVAALPRWPGIRVYLADRRGLTELHD